MYNYNSVLQAFQNAKVVSELVNNLGATTVGSIRFLNEEDIENMDIKMLPKRQLLYALRKICDGMVEDAILEIKLNEITSATSSATSGTGNITTNTTTSTATVANLVTTSVAAATTTKENKINDQSMVSSPNDDACDPHNMATTARKNSATSASNNDDSDSNTSAFSKATTADGNGKRPCITISDNDDDSLDFERLLEKAWKRTWSVLSTDRGWTRFKAGYKNVDGKFYGSKEKVIEDLNKNKKNGVFWKKLWLVLTENGWTREGVGAGTQYVPPGGNLNGVENVDFFRKRENFWSFLKGDESDDVPSVRRSRRKVKKEKRT